MATVGAAPADPQAAAPADQGDIVVTGQRVADRNAINAKRQDSRIVDVISADDVGKMTDFNAGEALRRVAGVNVWSYLGEPRFVTIRGFNTSFSTTTVDGFQMASPDNANYGAVANSTWMRCRRASRRRSASIRPSPLTWRGIS